MAEIVGIMAAVTQLADLASTLLLRVNKLHTKIERLPENIQQTGRSLRQFAALLTSLRLELVEQDGISGVLSEASISQAAELLADCGREIEIVDTLLIRVTPSVDDTKFKHARRVLNGLVKEDEIQSHLQQLGNLLPTLILWCNEQGLRLGWKQL
jgi:hypothetical protein